MVIAQCNSVLNFQNIRNTFYAIERTCFTNLPSRYVFSRPRLRGGRREGQGGGAVSFTLCKSVPLAAPGPCFKSSPSLPLPNYPRVQVRLVSSFRPEIGYCSNKQLASSPSGLNGDLCFKITVTENSKCLLESGDQRAFYTIDGFLMVVGVGLQKTFDKDGLATLFLILFLLFKIV